MNAIARFALFLSCYSPLFGSFVLLHTFGSGWGARVCGGIAVLGILATVIVPAAARSITAQRLNITTVQPRDADVLAYVVTYFVPFMSMVADTTRVRLAVGLLVGLIAVLYVRSDFFYVNPFLALLGYRLFQVVSPAGSSVTLITKRRFVAAGTKVSARRLGDYVYWEAPS